MKPVHGKTRATIGAVTAPAARPFLEAQTSLLVRFCEVDALHIVWHGHYVNYFEEARRAFGRQHGIDYTVFLEQQVAVPVVQLRLDYFAPARLADTLQLTARLLRSEAARLEFEYEIHRASDHTLLATGSTVQVFTTPAGELLLMWPSFMVERLKTWENLWQPPRNPSPSR